MVAVVTQVQRFYVKLLYTRSRATDGSTIARGLRGAIYRGGKGVNASALAHSLDASTFQERLRQRTTVRQRTHPCANAEGASMHALLRQRNTVRRRMLHCANACRASTHARLRQRTAVRQRTHHCVNAEGASTHARLRQRTAAR